MDAAAEKAGKSDESAKQFIALNKTKGLFEVDYKGRNNPFLNGNSDGSWTQEQQARFGAKNPTEWAAQRVANAMAVSAPCTRATGCSSKIDAIVTAVDALEQEKQLYQNDPNRKAQIEVKQATLLSKISEKDVELSKLDAADQATLLEALGLAGLPSGAGRLGQTISNLLSKFSVGKAVQMDAAQILKEAAAANPQNRLLVDATPRDGSRLVLNQGNVPTCGHNSCAMVMDTFGRKVDVAELVIEAAPSEKGINIYKVADLFKSRGVDALPVAGRNVDDLIRYTATGTPVVVRIADRATDFSHFVVVDGVTTRQGVQVVAIRDPQGIQYFSPVETFKKSFTGEVVLPRIK